MRTKRDKSSGRDPGGFVALPWSVLDSDAYRNLSVNARALLIEVARQFRKDNNGRMLLSGDYLLSRGWTSYDMATKGKRELLDNKLIFETCMGQRPNKASWYAITWQTLDKLQGYDPGADLMFKRGAYLNVPPRPRTVKRDTSAARAARVAQKRLTPSHGVERHAIAPSHGVEKASATPSHGAIEALFDPLSTPSHGDHLDIPSPAALSETRQAHSTSRQGPKGRDEKSRSPSKLNGNDPHPLPAPWVKQGERSCTRRDGTSALLDIVCRPCKTCGAPFIESIPHGSTDSHSLDLVNCSEHRRQRAKVKSQPTTTHRKKARP